MFSNITSNISSNVSNWLPSTITGSYKDVNKEEDNPSIIPANDNDKGAADDVDTGSNEKDAVVENATTDQQLDGSGDAIPPEKSDIQVGVEGVATNAVQSAKYFGSFLFNVAGKAGKTVTEAASKVKYVVEENSFFGEFNKEQQEFACQQKSSSEPAIPPWVGYPEEEILKQQILALSQDRRNFVRSPPSGVEFNFNYTTMCSVALATLKEDPNLEKMRFELVPKVVNEETFWRNYFYRVSLIKQSTQLSSLSQETDSNAVNLRNEEDSAVSPRTELVDDGSPKEEAWEQELQQELQEYEVVGDSNPADDPEWEKEVQELLEAESAE